MVMQTRLLRSGACSLVKESLAADPEQALPVAASSLLLEDKLSEFIEYYNRTFAKPLSWTYTGRPTNTPTTQRPRTWREKIQTTKIEKILALVA
jgi:hypothetical protein